MFFQAVFTVEVGWPASSGWQIRVLVPVWSIIGEATALGGHLGRRHEAGQPEGSTCGDFCPAVKKLHEVPTEVSKSVQRRSATFCGPQVWPLAHSPVYSLRTGGYGI